MVEGFACKFRKAGDIGVNIVVVHSQLVKFCCSVVRFVGVGSRLNKFFFEVVVDGVGWSGRCRNGHDPVLHTLLPLVDVRSGQVGEGMCHFAPQVLHNGMGVVHELVELEFVEEFVSLQLIPIEG